MCSVRKQVILDTMNHERRLCAEGMLCDRYKPTRIFGEQWSSLPQKDLTSTLVFAISILCSIKSEVNDAKHKLSLAADLIGQSTLTQ